MSAAHLQPAAVPSAPLFPVAGSAFARLVTRYVARETDRELARLRARLVPGAAELAAKTGLPLEHCTAAVMAHGPELASELAERVRLAAPHGPSLPAFTDMVFRWRAAGGAS